MRTIGLACTVAALCVGTSAYAQPIATPGTEGFLVIAGANEVIAKDEGNSASFSNNLYLQNTGEFIFNHHTSPVGSTKSLGTFAPGTELIFRLEVTNTGNNFFTGPGSRNPDGQPHARVQSDWLTPGTTLVSFEDLFNGPFVYNDLSFSFTNTVGSPSGVPEPSTWVMLIAGFGLVARLMRRRRAAGARITGQSFV